MNSELEFDEFGQCAPRAWRDAAEAVMPGVDLDNTLSAMTLEGILLKPIYDSSNTDGRLEIGERPGKASITRGTDVAGSEINRWWVAQDVPWTDPDHFNELIRAELMRGRNVVTLPLDSKSAGLQSGRNGLCIESVDDLRRSLHGIDLQAAPLFAWAGPSALPLLGMLESLKGESPWSGAVLADPLSESLLGRPQRQVEDCWDEMAVATKWAMSRAAAMRTVGVQGHLWGDAGATAVDELAYTLAIAVEYFRAMVNRGVEVSQLGRQFVVSLSLGCDVFMQVAKLRAVRILWSKVLTCFGAEPSPIFLHARSCRFNKSILDPHTNILRSTVEGMAGVIGGANSLHLSPWDEVMAGTDPHARRLAINTQLLLAEECGMAKIADPAGGAWYVESLTNELARKVWAKFQGIEKAGGIAELLQSGDPQKSMAESAHTRLERMARCQDKMVGVNLSPSPTEQSISTAVERKLSDKESGPDQGSSPRIIPRTMEAVMGEFRTGTPLVEVRAKLGWKADQDRQIPSLNFQRGSQEFEELRQAIEKLSAKIGAQPLARLYKIGGPKQWSARVAFARGFFAVSGCVIEEIPVESHHPVETRTERCSTVSLIGVLCGDEADYHRLGPNFVEQLKVANPGMKVFQIGSADGMSQDAKHAGIDGFVSQKTDCLAFLRELIRQFEESF